MKVVTTAAVVARRYRTRIQRWAIALRAGLRDIGVAVEAAAERLLRGSGPPGSYPVPIRTGNLRRSLGFRTSATEVVVFNTAAYARAIHDGMTPYNSRNARLSYIGRPYLSDAAAQVRPNDLMFLRLREAMA